MVKLLDKFSPEIQEQATEIYHYLRRSLKRRQGFGILFVRCSPVQGEEIITRIKQDIPEKKVAILELTESIDNLYDLIDDTVKQNQNNLDILFITGVEKSLVDYIKPGIGGQGDYYKLDTVPPLLGHLNWQRERFRDNFNICLVFIVPKFVLKYLVRRAPDFFDWRSGVFDFPSNQENLAMQTQNILDQADFNEYLKLSSLQRQQKILEIKEIIEETHQTEDNKATLWFEIGNIYIINQEYEDAIAAYDHALEIKPDKDQAWNNKGVALGNLGRYEEAIAAYDHALQIKPDKDEAWNNKGNVLGNLGRHEEAITAYDQALQIKPDKDEAWNNRGYALLKMGKYDEGMESVNKSISNST
jgi:tetratricopeptide (TPR) repeat protein